MVLCSQKLSCFRGLAARNANFALPIPNLTMVTPELDKRFASLESLVKVKPNYVYLKLIDKYAWIVE